LDTDGDLKLDALEASHGVNGVYATENLLLHFPPPAWFLDLDSDGDGYIQVDG